MRKLFPLFILWLITSVVYTTVAQSECPALVEFALSTTGEFCEETGRNQACFGHVNLTAEAQPDANAFEFVEVGDIVDVATIRTLRLSTLDTTAGAWGVVLMRVQANLPDSLPGQNITFMLFGDTEIRNAANSVEEQMLTTIDAEIRSSISANIRVGPNSTMAVLASIPSGIKVTANGISTNGEWIRIVLPETTNDQGWVSRQLIASDADFNTLNIIQPGQPQFGPMQAFYLSTGIGQPTCDEVPDNGLLVQTPKGVGEINLLVNEVEISMGSTVFLSAPRNESNEGEGVNSQSMIVKTIEGAAITRKDNETFVALGGSQFEIMYDDDGEIMEIGRTVTLDLEEIDDLPYEILEREIEIEEALTDEELDILDDYDDLFDLVDIEETDELLDYIDEFGDDDLIEFLQEDLDIEYFDGEMAEFFEEELDIEIEGFEGFDDEFDDEFDELDDEFDEFDDEFDEFDDEFDEGFDEFDEEFDEFDEFDEDEDFDDEE